MKLKITLASRATADRDVLVTADVTATIGDLARHLAAPAEGAMTLRVESPAARRPRVLNPAAHLHESSLRSGCRVEVVPVGELRAGDERDDAPVALVRVLTGPEAGRSFPLASGAHLVGRDAAEDVHLAADPEVSRRHATIVAGDTITVTDLNSANGVLVDGALVQRAIVTPSTRLQIGAGVLTVLPLTVPQPSSHVEPPFFRSPRVEPAYRGVSFTLPEIPVPPDPPRLPLLVLLSPLLLGAVLFALTQQVTTLAFVALSPLIMLGTWLDNRRQGRRRRRAGRSAFEAGMADARARSEAERDTEVRARCTESPGTSEVASAIGRRDPLLWTRRPEHATFLEVRFGVGRQASRSSIRLPSTNAGDAADWAAALALVEEFAEVGRVPVVETFERAGAIGVAGVGAIAREAACALVVQLAGLHSPADLVIAAFAGGDAVNAWSWLKWLPHVDSPHSPLHANGLVSDYAAGTALLSELEGLVAARRAAGSGRAAGVRSRLDEAAPLDNAHGTGVDQLPAVPAIVVVVNQEAPADRARLVALADEGPDCGVFVLWLAAAIEALPAVCRTTLVIDPATARAEVRFVRAGRTIALQTIESIDDLAAETAARSLAPVADTGARVLDESDLPRSVSFAELYGGDVTGDPAAIIQRWVKNDSLTRGWITGVSREAGPLRAVVGQGAAEAFAPDLRAHGPHALVGGTTGSGKSEFLQSWIMGLATEYSPDRLTFLLVDYKGGAAFAECVGLPHTVGLVTDLTPHLVRRALTSLRAELRHRELLLNRAGAKDLLTLEKRSDPDAPPVLVIVIDEFAALATDVPEFVDGVIDVAQRGRSLGLHLVMATQRPSGVIKDSLRANTNLRVALRVADEADSVDVLGVADAAAFDSAAPGRGAAKLGPGRIVDFQTAYLGGRSAAAAPAAEVHVQELPFGPGRPWVSPDDLVPAVAGDRDIERLADSIARAADARRIEVPRRPWLDQLPATVDLRSIRSAEDGRIGVGIVDEPETQSQSPFVLDLDVVGTVAVIGAGGSGKSALLRTVAVAASTAAAAHPVELYVIDAAGGALGMLEALPTVGSVIDGADVERITRLLARLDALVTERSAALAAARAASLADYRQTTGQPAPRVILLLDGFGAFRGDYEFRDGGRIFDRLLALASSGRRCGVHLIVTADRAGAFPTALAATIGERLVLRLAGETEYSVAGVPGDVLTDAPAGRLIAGTHEVQIAVPGGSGDLAAQSVAVEAIAERLRALPVAAVPPIERLGTHIPAGSLPTTVDGRPTFGVADETLEPIGLPLGGLFVVTGPFGSGRTTAVKAAVGAIREARPGIPAYLITARRSALVDAADWTEWSGDGDRDGAGDRDAGDRDGAERLAARLTEELERAAGETGPWPLIVIENVGDFDGHAAEGQVARLIAAARRAGVTVLAEADTVTAAGAWQIYSELKTARAGIVLQPEESDGVALFRVPFPRVSRSEFPVGRGILVDGGRLTRVQVAFPDVHAEMHAKAGHRLRRRRAHQ